MPDPLPLLPTTLVGSYPQPDWLIDREKLAARFPPRVRARELWRVDPSCLEEAQDDATLLAIRDQERAGLDIVTDGEIRRESYSNRFATALDGIDLDNPGTALDRSGHPNPVPRVVGPVRAHATRSRSRDVRVPAGEHRPHDQDHGAGPVHDVPAGAERATTTSEAELALDYADAVNEEIPDLFAAGADIVQIDEPYMQARPETGARATASRRCAARSTACAGTTALHICFGYAGDHATSRPPTATRSSPSWRRARCDQISIETAQSDLDLAVLEQLAGQDDHPRRARPRRPDVETPETVAERIRRALPYKTPRASSSSRRTAA